MLIPMCRIEGTITAVANTSDQIRKLLVQVGLLELLQPWPCYHITYLGDVSLKSVGAFSKAWIVEIDLTILVDKEIDGMGR